MGRAETLWWTRTNQFNHYSRCRSRTSAMRTGSQIPLTQDQVRLAFILQGPHSPITVAAFRANKPSDIISTLVSIYDSKELFVKELQVLLAQRLLAITDGNFDREVRTSIRTTIIAHTEIACSAATSRSLKSALARQRCKSVRSCSVI